jgi:hypothetical protein
MANLKTVLVNNGQIPDHMAEIDRQTRSVLNEVYRNLKFIPSDWPLRWKGDICMMVATKFGLHTKKYQIDETRKDWWEDFSKELRLRHTRKRNNVGNEVRKKVKSKYSGWGKQCLYYLPNIIICLCSLTQSWLRRVI